LRFALGLGLNLAVIVFLSAFPAQAEERVRMYRDSAIPDISFIHDKWPYSDGNCPSDRGEIAVADDDCLIRITDYFAGRYDLDLDGQDELFVMLAHPYWNGSIGSPLTIYKMKDGEWREWAWSSLKSSSRDDQGIYYYLVVGDEREKGLPVLYSSEFEFRWWTDPDTGESRYYGKCVSKQCQNENG